jgi:hypothetical protein
MKPKPSALQASWNAFVAIDQEWHSPSCPPDINPADWTPPRPSQYPPTEWWAALENFADRLAEAGNELLPHQLHPAAMFLARLLQDPRVETKFSSHRAAAALVVFAQPLHEVAMEPVSDLVTLHKDLPGGPEQLAKVIGVPQRIASQMIVAAQLDGDGREEMFAARTLGQVCKKLLPENWVDPVQAGRQKLLDSEAAEFQRASELWPKMRRHFDDENNDRSPMELILNS